MTSFLFIIKVPVEEKKLKKKESTTADKQTAIHSCISKLLLQTTRGNVCSRKREIDNTKNLTAKEKDVLNNTSKGDECVTAENTRTWQNVEHCSDSGKVTDKSNDNEEIAVNSSKSELDKNISKSETDNLDVNNSGNKISEVDKVDKTENLTSSSSEIDKVEWDFGDDEKSLLLDDQTVQDPNPDLIKKAKNGDEDKEKDEKPLSDSEALINVSGENEEEKTPLLDNQAQDDLPDNKDEASPTKKFDVLPVNESLSELNEKKSSASLASELKLGSLASESKLSTASLKSKEEENTKTVQFKSQVSVPDDKDLHNFIEQTTLLEDTECILKSYEIDNYSVMKAKNGKFYTILFVDEGGEKCESILNSLTAIFIGEKKGTSIGIYPSSIFKCKDVESSSTTEEKGSDYEGEFRKSIKARLLVSQVVTAVQSNAEFKFDFLMLIITASIIASLGLIESSSVILVASMLVSPLMGPILAGTFGFVVKNYSLRNLGIQSEVKGLIICVISGFLVGLLASSIAVHYGTLGGTESWPTDEMKSRGVLRGLVPGLLIALASGIGVALSVLGGNAGSLVGVAISASLLPPAVNAGMLWAHSIITLIRPPELIQIIDIVNNSTNQTTPNSSTLACPAFLNNKYIPEYSCRIEVESVYLGFVSLSLTILNIICIFFVGIIFLKIKEVAPQTSVSDETREFWNNDIKIARESYETMKGKTSLTIGAQAKKLAEEWRKEQAGEKGFIYLRGLIEDVENDTSVQGVQKYIPGSNRSRPFSQQLGPEFSPDIFPTHYNLPRNTYHTYHYVPRQPSGSSELPRSSTPPARLETIKESDTLSEDSSQGSRHSSFFNKLQNNKLLKRRTQSDSYDVNKSRPV